MKAVTVEWWHIEVAANVCPSEEAPCKEQRALSFPQEADAVWDLGSSIYPCLLCELVTEG